MRCPVLVVLAVSFGTGCASPDAATPVVAPIASPAPPPAPAPPTAATLTRAPLPPAPASPPAAPPHPEPPAAFVRASDAAGKAILAGDAAAADRALDAAAAAAAAAGDDPHLRFRVAYLRASRFAYGGDFEHAAAAFLAVLPELARHTDSSDEFWAHNAMMMIREAQGDPAAALAENDQATLTAARGTWEPESRATLAYLKDRWHRAYLTRMLAESRKGSVKQGLVQYAEAALDDYKRRARELGSNEDSIAVLEAYFAALDGKREAARAAAARVDPAKDDDVEDLYLVVVGLAAGGDSAGAESVRRAMRKPSGVHLARPIMLRWLDHDEKARRDGTFTPWHSS